MKSRNMIGQLHVQKYIQANIHFSIVQLELLRDEAETFLQETDVIIVKWIVWKVAHVFVRVSYSITPPNPTHFQGWA